MFLGGLEQRAQGWQDIAQREVGQLRADLVETQGRLTAVESFVQDQGPQQMTWRAELAAMVGTQLEKFETRLQGEIRDWTEEAVKACEDLEEKVKNMQNQLRDVERLQKGLGYAQDAIC